MSPRRSKRTRGKKKVKYDVESVINLIDFASIDSSDDEEPRPKVAKKYRNATRVKPVNKSKRPTKTFVSVALSDSLEDEEPPPKVARKPRHTIEQKSQSVKTIIRHVSSFSSSLAPNTGTVVTKTPADAQKSTNEQKDSATKVEFAKNTTKPSKALSGSHEVQASNVVAPKVTDSPKAPSDDQKLASKTAKPAATKAPPKAPIAAVLQTEASKSESPSTKEARAEQPAQVEVAANIIPPAAAKVIIEAPPVIEYNSDEEPPTEDKEESLQWRGDPSVTLSDWTIEIASRSFGSTQTTVDTYHVHKTTLSIGPRKSEYFTNLFCRGGRYSESSSRTSQIELDPLAAAAFPQLLDYAYKTNGKEPLEIKSETATALHFLGQYFGMRRLRWEAKEFWKKDLKLDNATMHYEHGRVFHDEKLCEGIANVLVQKIKEITPSSKIVKESDSHLWMMVLEKLDDKVLKGTVIHLSEIIAAHAMENSEDLDAETFALLTSPENPPLSALRPRCVY